MDLLALSEDVIDLTFENKYIDMKWCNILWYSRHAHDEGWAALVQLLHLVADRMRRRYNDRYRETPWPQVAKDDYGFEHYTRTLLQDQMECALHEVLRTSPGLDIATNVFCGEATKQRIHSFLEAAAKKHELNLEVIVLEDNRFDFSSVPRKVVDLLMRGYLNHYDRVSLWPRGWLWQMDNILALGRLDMSGEPLMPNGNRLCFAVEGPMAMDPHATDGELDVFVLDFVVKMKEFELPKILSLADTIVNVMADDLYAKWEKTGEDQAKFITVEVLQIPATLIHRIAERYTHLKEKMVRFFHTRFPYGYCKEKYGIDYNDLDFF